MQNGKESMHVYARPPAGRARSPPLSPIHSPRHRLGRTRSGRQAGGGGPTRPYVIRLIFLLFSFLLRRHAVLLLAPVIYISGMLLYMGTLSLDLPSSAGVARGSVYRSPEVFEHLWPAMEADNDSSFGVSAFDCFVLQMCSVKVCEIWRYMRCNRSHYAMKIAFSFVCHKCGGMPQFGTSTGGSRSSAAGNAKFKWITM